MAAPRMDVSSFVGKLLEEDDVDVLRNGVRVLAQALMETEVSSQIGAAPYERSSSRIAYRNGYRTRTWDTRVGTIELRIPKVTAGTYFLSLVEPRRRAETLGRMMKSPPSPLSTRRALNAAPEREASAGGRMVLSHRGCTSSLGRNRQ
jgi:Transposase, Mutator family